MIKNLSGLSIDGSETSPTWQKDPGYWFIYVVI